MMPPKELNVLDQHGGFTAITTSLIHIKIIKDPITGERECTRADYSPTLTLPFVRWERVWRESSTLWRPGQLLKRSKTVGTLQEYTEQSFFQTNNNVTKAIYKVPGYRYRIAVWFDNVTGGRIA